MRATPGTFPPLTERQAAQLRRLSLVSLACTAHVVSYDDIQAALDLPDADAVELVVADAVDDGLLDARLDAVERNVHVLTVQARDVLPPPHGQAALDHLHTQLHAWLTRARATRDMLDARMGALQGEAQSLDRSAQEAHAALAAAMLEARAKLDEDAPGQGEAAAPRRGKRTRAAAAT